MSKVKTIDPKNISTAELHHYLLNAVAPRPIAFASTIDTAGRINLSPFSFFNVFSSNPPIMIFSPARRGRDNTTKHTLDNLEEVHEVVINTVNFEIVEQMSLTSSEFPDGVNEFVKAGLTPGASHIVKPPRVMESPVSFECKVNEVIPLGNEGGAGNLVICEVLLIHVNEEYLDSHGSIDPEKLDLVARMGGNWYCRVTTKSMFELPKPNRALGMGVERLPEYVRLSPILSGNELARLGNLTKLPTEKELEEVNQQLSIDPTLTKLDTIQKRKKLIELAKVKIAEGEANIALRFLINAGP